MSERALVFLVGAVQFVNILDFMMVAPLGVDYAKGLGMPADQIGTVVGAYTVGGAIAGFAGSFFLDRFDRRRALAVAALGLALGTLSCAFAVGLWSLVAARFLAGAFGGPATSVATSIIADKIPPERRGRAVAALAGAFSAASVIGVPAGLVMSRYGGWRLPFVVVAALGLIMVIFAVGALPSMTGHIDPTRLRLPLRRLFARPTVVLSYTLTAVVMFAGFLLIPNFAAYIQNNLGYPRDRYEFLYIVAGLFSLATMFVAGRSVDRWGSFRVGGMSSLAAVGLIILFILVAPTAVPVMVYFVAFFVVNSFRNVAYNTLTSKVPGPAERARFMSMQSVVQLSAMGLGSIVSGFMLSSLPDGRLVHLGKVAVFSIALTLIVPVFLWIVEERVKQRA